MDGEARIREIVREELRAAKAEELGHEIAQQAVRDSAATLQALNPVFQSDDALHERHRPFGGELVKFLRAYITFVTTDGAEGREVVEDYLGRFHRRGNLVQDGADGGSGIIGCGHNASPSVGADTPNVGEERSGSG
jgi:hypothetical protein